MKRRLLLILGTFAVLLLAVVVYSLVSREGLPESWRLTLRLGPPRGRPDVLPPENIRVWPTSRPEYLQYDKNHRLQARFQAALQQKVGERFYIDQPQVDWYLRGGEVVTIQASKGVIKASEAAGKWKMLEGDLSGDVWVTLDRGKDPDRRPLAERPGDAVRIHLDEAHFDNELLSIQSDGRLTLFAKEADILGKGLRLEWSEGPRELEQLRIEQGEYMCIREGQERFLTELSLPGGEGGPASAPSPASSAAPAEPEGWTPPSLRAGGLVWPVGLGPLLLAVGEEDQTARALPGGPPVPPEGAAPAVSPPVVKDTYVAVFTDDVKVTSGPRYLYGADELRLTFQYRPTDQTRRPASPPVPPSRRRKGPSGGVPAGAGAAPESPRRPADRAAPAPGPSARPPASASAPAGAAGEPIYVTWRGPLVITPLRGTQPPVEKRFDVFARGGRLELADLQAQAVCQTFQFHSPQQQGELTGGPGAPVRLRMARGETITVARVRFDRAGGVVNLDGAGTMVLPPGSGSFASGTSASPSSEAEELTIHWARQVVALIGQRTLTGDQGDRRQDFLRQAAFTDQVIARQGPSRTMNADEMTALFAEPRDQTDRINRVSRVQAAGAVQLADSQTGEFSRSRSLDIEMGTAEDGRTYPRVMTARGDVSARQENTDITGQEVIVTLAERPDPATGKNRPQPQGLQASGKVRIVDASNPQEPLTVQAESVDADLVGKTATLKGLPAKVIQKDKATGQDNVLAGESIFMDRQRELAKVTGKGTMRFHTDSDLSGNATGKPQPVDIAWTQAMDYRGAERTAVVSGDVKLDTAEDHLGCLTLRVLFAPPEPSSRPAPTTRPSRLAATEAFRPQKISMVMADQKVVLVSQRKDAEGYLERRLRLSTEQLVYAFAGTEGKAEPSVQTPSTRKINCYGPGELSVEDYRPPGATAGVAGSPQVLPGAKVVTPNQSAFQWSKAMEMDQQELTLRAMGDVHMVLREGDRMVLMERLKVRPWGNLPAGKISDLTCQRVLAQFDPPEPSPTSRPASAQTGPQVGQLKLFDAFGEASKPDDLVRLVDGPREVHCRRLLYARDKDVATIWGAMPGEPPRDAVMYMQDPQKKTLQVIKAGPLLVWYRATNRVEAKGVEAFGGR